MLRQPGMIEESQVPLTGLLFYLQRKLSQVTNLFFKYVELFVFVLQKPLNTHSAIIKGGTKFICFIFDQKVLMIMVARLRLLLQVVTPPIRKRKLPFQLQQGHFQRFAHLIIGIQSVKRSQEILIVLWMEPIDLLDSMLIKYLMRVRSLFILLFMRF